MEINFKAGKAFNEIDEGLEIVFTFGDEKGDPGIRNSSITRRAARRDRKRTLKSRARAKARG